MSSSIRTKPAVPRPASQATPARRGTAPVPAVAKAIAIVRRLNSVADATLPQIAADTGIGRSHCHAILRTLVDAGWVRYEPDRRCYGLGARIVSDSATALRNTARIERIHGLLEALARRISLPCVLSQPLPDGSFIVVDKVDGVRPTEVSVTLAQHYPPDAPVQMRAFLAWQDQDRIDAALAARPPTRHTRHTIAAPKRLRRELQATRRRGYAISRNEFIEGVVSVSVPLFDAEGAVAFIMQVPGFADDMTPRIEAIGAALMETQREIHRRWGAAAPGA